MDKLNQISDGQLLFFCPGCNDVHGVTPAKWAWNGSLTSPTFSPSVLVTSGHYVTGREGGHCWCTYNQEHPNDPAPFVCYRCHSFVKDGMIQFLNDCTHSLANKTVPIPEWNGYIVDKELSTDPIS